MPFPKYDNGDDLYFSEGTANVPANRSRLSFVPCPIEYVAGFDDNATFDNMQNRYQNYGEARFFQQMAAALCQDPPTPFNFNAPTKVDYNGAFFARNSTVVNETGAPQVGAVYKSATRITGLKYGLFIRKKPKQPGPMGVLPAFFSTGGVQDGSNCVGIISARQRVYKTNGGTLNIIVDSVFGGPGENKTISTGGNPGAGAGFLGGQADIVNNSAVPASSKYYAYYGNTSTRIEALGSVALHAQVWDAWPPYLTLYVAQYFTPLHFNPGTLGSSASTKVYDIDMIVPPLSVGTVVNSSTRPDLLPDIIDWDVDTTRRGVLVSGGFKYLQKTIGYDKANTEIRVAGEGYAAGDRLKNTNSGVEITVTSTSDGGVSGWSFAKDDDGNDLQGEDLNRSTFTTGKTLSFPKSGASKTCLIKFNQGKVIEKTRTEGPKQHISNQVLTPKADGTMGGIGIQTPPVVQNRTLNLPPNPNAPVPGAYDVFYHFQSDPAANPRTSALWGISGMVEQVKHVTITVN